MKAFLKNAFTEHVGVKLVALVSSIGLFALVHSEKDTTVYANVPVTYNQPQDRVLVSEPVNEVRLRITGAWTRIKTFDERDIDPISVDLEGLGEGEYNFSEDMFDLPPGMRVENINPPGVALRFEKSATKIVPVSPVLDGEPPRGYQVESAIARPSHVTIRGATSVVAVTQGARTERIPVTTATSSFVRNDISLAPLAGAVTVVGEPTVTVEVDISKEVGETVLEAVPVDVRAPRWERGATPPALTVAPETVRILLRGSRMALDEIDEDTLAAFVEIPADTVVRRPYPQVPVAVEGIPEGLAVDIKPRQVELRPAPAPVP